MVTVCLVVWTVAHDSVSARVLIPYLTRLAGVRLVPAWSP